MPALTASAYHRILFHAVDCDIMHQEKLAQALLLAHTPEDTVFLLINAATEKLEDESSDARPFLKGIGENLIGAP